MSTRTITITVTADNDFAVQEGEAFCHRLTWDEMLGQVAMLTMPDGLRDPARRHLFRMESADEMLSRTARHAARMHEIHEEAQ